MPLGGQGPRGLGHGEQGPQERGSWELPSVGGSQLPGPSLPGPYHFDARVICETWDTRTLLRHVCDLSLIPAPGPVLPALATAVLLAPLECFVPGRRALHFSGLSSHFGGLGRHKIDLGCGLMTVDHFLDFSLRKLCDSPC